MDDDREKKAFIEGFKEGLDLAFSEVDKMLARGFKTTEIKMMIGSKKATIHRDIDKKMKEMGLVEEEVQIDSSLPRLSKGDSVLFLEKDCKKLKEFRGQNERSFRAYLREITFHMTIDFLRKQRHFVNIEKVQGVIPDKRNKERLYIKELEEMIVALSAKLPKRQRFLFNLMFKEGLGQSQIAHLMELKLNAVHQLRHRMINNMIKFVREKHLVGDS